jgi:hypothetical protein
LYWKQKPARNVLIGQEAGTLHKFGYIHIRFQGKIYKAHRIAWALHYGEWPVLALDHKDRNRANNRINNLRQATSTQNHMNAEPKGKGVRYVEERKKWLARIADKHFGYFSTKEEAVAARNKAALEQYGEFARIL